MAQRVIDLSLTIEDNMPAHKLFQRPVITTHMSHESTKALNTYSRNTVTRLRDRQRVNRG
jgi:kynurenine formamidase